MNTLLLLAKGFETMEFSAFADVLTSKEQMEIVKSAMGF